MLDKTILITGGSGKLGRAMVTAALAEGYRVISTFHSKPISHQSTSQHKQLQQFPLDLLSEHSITELSSHIQQSYSCIDVLVHNARSLDSLKQDSEGWSDVVDLEREMGMAVSGPFELTKKILQANIKVKHILFINSIYGRLVPNKNLYPNRQHMPPLQYGVAKGAQLKLMQEWAIRFADRGIRVNSILFGGVEGRVDPEFYGRYAALCPQAKMLSEDDVKATFLSAIDGKLTAVTGQEWVCDGGWSLW